LIIELLWELTLIIVYKSPLISDLDFIFVYL
jgi:hypothetical protein